MYGAMPQSASGAVHVSNYEDALYVLRSPEFRPLRKEAGFNMAYQLMFTGGALIDLHGKEHFERRRILGSLFRRATLEEYESDYLAPAVREAIADLDASSTDPVDLLVFTWRIMIRLMVRLVGVDGLDTPEAEERFAEYFRDFEHGTRSRFSRDPEETVAKALVSRSILYEEFLEASWARRRAILADANAARPRDVLTLLLEHEDYYRDKVGDRAAEVMNNETAAFMAASIGSTANAICGAVYEIDRWLQDHPEDRPKLLDSEFLRTCFSESIRLHQTGPLMRQAAEDVRLPSGTEVPAQAVALIDRLEAGIELASRASQPGSGQHFDPYRTIDGVPQYVLAFGQGPHMCIGRQMVLGGHYTQPEIEETDTRVGLAVTVLSEYFRAGVRLVPDRAPIISGHTIRETWAEFPVYFAGPSA
jgi:cytochrome P450